MLALVDSKTKVICFVTNYCYQGPDLQCDLSVGCVSMFYNAVCNLGVSMNLISEH